MRATLFSALLSISSLASGLEWSDNQSGDFSKEKFVKDNIAASIRNRRVWNRPTKRQSDWSPPSDIASPLQEVWDHCLETYSNGLYKFTNYGWDQIKATDGKLNMCVRWESTASVTEAQRTQIATAINDQYQLWFKWLYGYDGFPFSKIEVNVVGWAVKDTSLLEGSTDGLDIYTDTDADGIPQCAEACGRYFNQNGEYSGCEGGEDRHYDQSLWLTEGMAGGAGGDWGQRIGSEYFVNALGSEAIHILLHEMGHTFGLDDFYDWTPTGIDSFIMLAGSSAVITDFDGWMLRNWWYELSRDRGWQSGTGSDTPSSTISDEASSTTPIATSTVATSTAYPTTTSVIYPDTTSTDLPEATPSAYPDTTSNTYPDTTPTDFPEATPSSKPQPSNSAGETGSRPTPTSGSRPSCGKSRKSFSA